MSQKLTPLQRFQRLLALEKKDITQVYVYAFFNGVVNLTLPLGIQAIVNLIQGGEPNASWYILVTFVIIGVALTGILQLLQLRIVENLAQRIFGNASFEFALRIPKIKYQAFRDYYGPDLANRFFDTLTIQKALPKILIDFSLGLFQVIVGLFVLSLYHPFFIIFSVLLLVVVYLIIAATGPRGLRTSIQESTAKYKIAFWLEEMARSKLSFKLASNNKLGLRKTDEHVDTYLKARENHFNVIIAQSAYLIVFKVLVASGLLITGSILVFNEQMNIGQFVAAEIIIILIIASVEKIIKTIESIYDILTALEKIGFVFDKPIDDYDGVTLKESDDSFEVSAENLSYRYDNAAQDTLTNINFTIPTNKSILISGPPSAGKSTLLRLISGILEPADGIIKYNGFPIKSLDFDVLKREIGFYLSNNEIFFGTILENISMDRENATPENINRAIALTGLSPFLAKMPLGFKTIIDPEGKKTPSNVQNRILLARALATNPKLLILEDPLDHIESQEKEQIVKAICSEENRWSIIVSSVDTIWNKYISETIELKDGQIVNN